MTKNRTRNILISLNKLISIFHTMHSYHPTFQKSKCENCKRLEKEKTNNEKEQVSGLGFYLDYLDVIF